MPRAFRNFCSFRAVPAQFLGVTLGLGSGVRVKQTLLFLKFPSNSIKAGCLKTGLFPITQRRGKERKIIDLSIKTVITTTCC